MAPSVQSSDRMDVFEHTALLSNARASTCRDCRSRAGWISRGSMKKGEIERRAAGQNRELEHAANPLARGFDAGLAKAGVQNLRKR